MKRHHAIGMSVGRASFKNILKCISRTEILLVQQDLRLKQQSCDLEVVIDSMNQERCKFLASQLQLRGLTVAINQTQAKIRHKMQEVHIDIRICQLPVLICV